MIKEIVKDIKFLSQTSEKFDLVKNKKVIQDLLDTANSYGDECMGLSAIQIGYPLRVFVVKDIKTGKFIPYINPVIVSKSSTKFRCSEGCLSLDITKEVMRYTWVKLMYTDSSGKIQTKSFSGVESECIQHEYDHLHGKTLLDK